VRAIVAGLVHCHQNGGRSRCRRLAIFIGKCWREPNPHWRCATPCLSEAAPKTLKAYRCTPAAQRRVDLEAEFDRIFTGKTGFVTLDRLLARLHANKTELLKVLERPELLARERVITAQRSLASV
jgi:hypothetical protein